MSRKALFGFTALLAAVALVAALAVPAMALAAVGGPYSQTISNPDDNGIANIPTDGGDYAIGASGKVTLSVPAGAVLSSKVVTVTVWSVRGGKPAEDGSVMSSIMEWEPDGLIFEKPIGVSYVYPPGLRNPRAYGWDEDVDAWIRIPTTVVGPRAHFNVTHFSSYAIGDSPVSTPASSPWSLALLAVSGVAIVALAIRRGRGQAAV